MTDRAKKDRPEGGSRKPSDASAKARVKVTDKRRVSADAGPPAPPAPTTEDQGGTAELDRAQAQAAEYLDDLRRLKAEFENYRKRVLREQTRAVELAAEPLMAKLLEVLDEFELALMAAERQPEFERFLHGVELVFAKLKDILGSEGLEAIDANGEPFDPQIHEALLQSEDQHEGDPYVSDVLRTGYTLKGRVIRPSGVKVGRR